MSTLDLELEVLGCVPSIEDTELSKYSYDVRGCVVFKNPRSNTYCAVVSVRLGFTGELMLFDLGKDCDQLKLLKSRKFENFGTFKLSRLYLYKNNGSAVTTQFLFSGISKGSLTLLNPYELTVIKSHLIHENYAVWCMQVMDDGNLNQIRIITCGWGNGAVSSLLLVVKDWNCFDDSSIEVVSAETIYSGRFYIGNIHQLRHSSNRHLCAISHILDCNEHVKNSELVIFDTNQNRILRRRKVDGVCLFSIESCLSSTFSTKTGETRERIISCGAVRYISVHNADTLTLLYFFTSMRGDHQILQFRSILRVNESSFLLGGVCGGGTNEQTVRICSLKYIWANDVDVVHGEKRKNKEEEEEEEELGLFDLPFDDDNNSEEESDVDIIKMRLHESSHQSKMNEVHDTYGETQVMYWVLDINESINNYNNSENTKFIVGTKNGLLLMKVSDRNYELLGEKEQTEEQLFLERSEGKNSFLRQYFVSLKDEMERTSFMMLMEGFGDDEEPKLIQKFSAKFLTSVIEFPKFFVCYN